MKPHNNPLKPIIKYIGTAAAVLMLQGCFKDTNVEATGPKIDNVDDIARAIAGDSSLLREAYRISDSLRRESCDRRYENYGIWLEEEAGDTEEQKKVTITIQEKETGEIMTVTKLVPVRDQDEKVRIIFSKKIGKNLVIGTTPDEHFVFFLSTKE